MTNRTTDSDREKPSVESQNARRAMLAKGIGISFIVIGIALNIYTFIDAIRFDMGEQLAPACGSFREIFGFDLLIVAFLAQITVCLVLILISRSWLVAILSVFPFWALFWSQICIGIV
jgi:hypothetical protein